MKNLVRASILSLAGVLAFTGCKTNCCCSSTQPETQNGLQQVQRTAVWTAAQPAAPGSVEAKLRARGKTWTRTNDEIKPGSYVQDTLEGRLNQPIGRGAIGKVVFVAKGDNDQLDAMVDFGRGY